MFTRNIISVFVTILLLSSSAYSVDTKTIYIEIVGKAKFEVLYHRVTSNTVGADVGGVGFLFPVGGVIGAGIQSGIEASKDEDKTKQLKPLIEKEGWKTQFLDTLNDKLEVEGFTAVWVEDTRDIEDGIVLRIYPKNFGFKRVDTSTQLVSAFIDFKASFWRGNLKSSKKQEKEAYYFTNRNRYPFNKLLEEDSPLNSDLEEVLEKAAKRLANKIIYGLKE